MPTLFGSVGRLVHETSGALIDRQIPEKLSELVSGTVRAGFDVAEDVLVIIREVTAPEPAPAGSEEPVPPDEGDAVEDS